MDKMREEFEFWCSGKLVLRLFGDNYDNSSTQLAWLAWKASRSALCVELPEPEMGHGCFVSKMEVEIALDNAGVPYK